MRFLLDERAEARIATFRTNLGHDATRVARDDPAGFPDERVLDIARQERRIPITNDRDFGELIVRKRLPHSGVIFSRFPLDATAREKIAVLQRLLATGVQSDRFVVVTPRDVRVRRPTAGAGEVRAEDVVSQRGR